MSRSLLGTIGKFILRTVAGDHVARHRRDEAPEFVLWMSGAEDGRLYRIELIVEELDGERLYRVKRPIEEELHSHARVVDH